jgi:uncharacterized membrane protein
MVATVIWIGGLFFQSVVLHPALRHARDPGELLESLRRRFQPLAWLSLAVLIGTGLLQMSANANYSGLLSIANPWSQAIFAKHLAIALMIMIGAYQTWVLHPQLTRLALLGSGAEQRRRLSRIGQANLVLGILILGLTGLARTL